MIISILFLLIGCHTKFKVNLYNDSQKNLSQSIESEELNTSNSDNATNYEIIQEIMMQKLTEYNSLGYFSQYYVPSIQAIYNALSVASFLDLTGMIDKSSLLSFIIDRYNDEENIFSDEYSDRYLDTDFNLTYYPLNSLLEVNCYAYLCLDILNKTNLINTGVLIDFIWSCFNYEEGGFIGRPYHHDLETSFKKSTLDNTYYAILVLNKTLDDWSDYSTEKTKIIDFVLSLQSNVELDPFFGGFSNDKDIYFQSLDEFEPNLLSCYYAISILDTFQQLSLMRTQDFHTYLKNLYHMEGNFFKFAGMYHFENYSNIVGSSIGLELGLK
jgi:prenyltransferase beta subunit